MPILGFLLNRLFHGLFSRIPNDAIAWKGERRVAIKSLELNRAVLREFGSAGIVTSGLIDNVDVDLAGSVSIDRCTIELSLEAASGRYSPNLEVVISDFPSTKSLSRMLAILDCYVATATIGKPLVIGCIRLTARTQSGIAVPTLHIALRDVTATIEGDASSSTALRLRGAIGSIDVYIGTANGGIELATVRPGAEDAHCAAVDFSFPLDARGSSSISVCVGDISLLLPPSVAESLCEFIEALDSICAPRDTPLSQEDLDADRARFYVPPFMGIARAVPSWLDRTFRWCASFLQAGSGVPSQAPAAPYHSPCQCTGGFLGGLSRLSEALGLAPPYDYEYGDEAVEPEGRLSPASKAAASTVTVAITRMEVSISDCSDAAMRLCAAANDVNLAWSAGSCSAQMDALTVMPTMGLQMDSPLICLVACTARKKPRGGDSPAVDIDVTSVDCCIATSMLPVIVNLAGAYAPLVNRAQSAVNRIQRRLAPVAILAPVSSVHLTGGLCRFSLRLHDPANDRLRPMRLGVGPVRCSFECEAGLDVANEAFVAQGPWGTVGSAELRLQLDGEEEPLLVASASPGQGSNASHACEDVTRISVGVVHAALPTRSAVSIATLIKPYVAAVAGLQPALTTELVLPRVAVDIDRVCVACDGSELVIEKVNAEAATESAVTIGLKLLTLHGNTSGVAVTIAGTGSAGALDFSADLDGDALQARVALGPASIYTAGIEALVPWVRCYTALMTAVSPLQPSLPVSSGAVTEPSKPLLSSVRLSLPSLNVKHRPTRDRDAVTLASLCIVNISFGALWDDGEVILHGSVDRVGLSVASRASHSGEAGRIGTGPALSTIAELRGVEFASHDHIEVLIISRFRFEADTDSQLPAMLAALSSIAQDIGPRVGVLIAAAPKPVLQPSLPSVPPGRHAGRASSGAIVLDSGGSLFDATASSRRIHAPASRIGEPTTSSAVYQELRDMDARTSRAASKVAPLQLPSSLVRVAHRFTLLVESAEAEIHGRSAHGGNTAAAPLAELLCLRLSLSLGNFLLRRVGSAQSRSSDGHTLASASSMSTSIGSVGLFIISDAHTNTGASMRSVNASGRSDLSAARSNAASRADHGPSHQSRRPGYMQLLQSGESSPALDVRLTERRRVRADRIGEDQGDADGFELVTAADASVQHQCSVDVSFAPLQLHLRGEDVHSAAVLVRAAHSQVTATACTYSSGARSSAPSTADAPSVHFSSVAVGAIDALITSDAEALRLLMSFLPVSLPVAVSWVPLHNARLRIGGSELGPVIGSAAALSQVSEALIWSLSTDGVRSLAQTFPGAMIRPAFQSMLQAGLEGVPSWLRGAYREGH